LAERKLDVATYQVRDPTLKTTDIVYNKSFFIHWPLQRNDVVSLSPHLRKHS